MYSFTQGEVEVGSSKVVASQISIAHTSAYTLIDYRVSHSFVFATFVKKLDMVPDLLDEMCIISQLLGENLTSRFSFKVVPIKVAGRELPFDLIVLKMVDYDVIQGIDWLSKNNATIYCIRKNVVFQPSKGDIFQYKGIP